MRHLRTLIPLSFFLISTALIMGFSSTCAQPPVEPKINNVNPGMASDQALRLLDQKLDANATEIQKLKVLVRESSGPSGLLTILIILNIALTCLLGVYIWQTQGGRLWGGDRTQPTPENAPQKEERKKEVDDMGSDYFRGE